MLDSLFPQANCRFLSLPLLGPIADGFDDWLAANGYTPVSRQNLIRMLPHVDAELRHLQVKKLDSLTRPVLRGCWRTLRKDRASARIARTLERYLAVNGLITDGKPATGVSPALMVIEEYANRYAKVDLEMKRKAIPRVKAVPRQPRTPWSKDPTVLDWLESL